MSFRGEAVITATETGSIQDGHFNVLNCSFRFYSPTDSYGRITGRRVVGKIFFQVETVPNCVALSHLFFTNSSLEGTLTFYQRDNLAKLYEVSFQNARIIDMETQFSGNGEMPMTTSLMISSERISLESGSISAEDNNDWRAESDF